MVIVRLGKQRLDMIRNAFDDWKRKHSTEALAIPFNFLPELFMHIKAQEEELTHLKERRKKAS